MAMLAAALQERLKKESPPHADSAAQLVRAAEQAMSQVRTIGLGLLPIEVEGEGLMAALAELADSVCKLHDLQCSFECLKPVLINDTFVATHLYYIAQEAVHNAVKHARARKIAVRLQGNGATVLMIEDDGVGLERKVNDAKGHGMRIMGYRARLIGGQLVVAPNPGGGVRVVCTRPHKQIG
jgi:signal transduction histidine kinase